MYLRSVAIVRWLLHARLHQLQIPQVQLRSLLSQLWLPHLRRHSGIVSIDMPCGLVLYNF